MSVVKILGVEIDQVTFTGALEQISSFVTQRGPHQVVTVNPEFVMRARHDAAFRKVLNDADLAVADGAGLIWASRLINRRRGRNATDHRSLILPERVTGTDLLPALITQAASKDWKVYLLGGGPGIAARTAELFIKTYPKLRIVGAEMGPLITESGLPLNTDQSALLEANLTRIKHAKPDLLFVAFGAPKQDRFIARYRDQLKVPVMIGVGGAFDFVTGKVRRAPVIFRALSLEWLWRLIMEPWRFKRIWTATISFPLAVLNHK